MLNILKPIRRAALLSVALLGWTACQGDPTPVGLSENTAPTFVEVNGVKLVTTSPGNSLDPADGGAIRLVNKLLGAVLQTSDVKLVIKPFSVKSGVTITIEPISGPFVMFKFGPNGTTFSPAAELTISAAKADVDAATKQRLKIAGASDDAEDWTIIGGTYNPSTDSVTVPISHFSRYALCVE